jgi:hypothetical protein
MRFLRILFIAVAVAFGLLLAVGFDNVLAVFRSRVAILLAIGPIFLLFVWCLYKAFQPPRLPDRPNRDEKPV